MEENIFLTKELYDLNKQIKKVYQETIESYTYEKYNQLITTNNAEIMAYLRDNSDMEVHPKDIEKLLLIKPSTVTEVLKKMEIKKLIKKRKSKTDSRYIVLKLTKKGKNILDEASKRMYQIEDKVTETLTYDEVNNLKAYLQKIKDNM